MCIGSMAWWAEPGTKHFDLWRQAFLGRDETDSLPTLPPASQGQPAITVRYGLQVSCPDCFKPRGVTGPPLKSWLARLFSAASAVKFHGGNA